MKRFISAILVICMAAMFLPTVAAAEEPIDVYTFGFDYTYVNANGDNGWSINPLRATYETTGGKMASLNSESPYAPIDWQDDDTIGHYDVISTTAGSTRTMYRPNDDGFRISTSSNGTTVANGRLAIILKLQVPEGENYNLFLEYVADTSGLNAKTYFIPTGNETIDAEFEAQNLEDFAKDMTELTNLVNKYTDVDTYLVGEIEEGYSASRVIRNENIAGGISGGEYWVIINADGKNEGCAPKNGEYQFVLRKLIFDKSAPAAISSAADKEVLSIGEKTVISSEVTLSSANVTDTYPVTYSTENTDVVSVDSKTGVVTANAAGKATITATAADGVTDTVNVTVINADSEKYTYSTTYTGLGVASGANYVSAAISFSDIDVTKSMLWEKAAYNSVARYVLYHYADYQIQQQHIGSAYLVYRLYVPKAGNYHLNILPFKSVKSGIADIYVAKDTGATISGVPSASGPIKEADKKVTGLNFHNSSSTPATVEVCDIAVSEPGSYLVAIVPTGIGNADLGGTDGWRQVNFGHYGFEVVPFSDADILENAFDATSEAAIYSAPSVSAFKYNKDTSGSGSVISVPDAVNGVYTIEAPVAEAGEEFLYWAIGLAGNRKILSFEETLVYKPSGQGVNYLIAVYEKEGEDGIAKAEFYNANGQLIPDTEGTAPATPTMAGVGAFMGWKQYGSDVVLNAGDSFEVTGTMIFVAQYEDAANITVKSNVAADKIVPFGTEVSFTASPAGGEVFKWWTKTNAEGETEIVSTANTYSFFAWENCEVNAVYGSKATGYAGSVMKILIDIFGEDSVMAEFIGFENVNVVEKGIMLGTEKFAMTSDKTQFTIVNDEDATSISGYAIIDNGDQTFTEICDK